MHRVRHVYASADYRVRSSYLLRITHIAGSSRRANLTEIERGQCGLSHDRNDSLSIARCASYTHCKNIYRCCCIGTIVNVRINKDLERFRDERSAFSEESTPFRRLIYFGFLRSNATLRAIWIGIIDR